MQEEHRQSIDVLQAQLEKANFALTNRPETPTTKSPSHDSDLDHDQRLDLRHEERQAAEVSLNTLY